MLKIQEQGHNECFPTTVAMLAGVPKDEVVEWALIGSPYNFWAEIPHSERPEYQQAICDAFLPWLDGVQAGKWGDPETLPARPTDLALLCFEKRGAFSFVTARGEAHIVAFDHGIVFDPSGGLEVFILDYIRMMLDNEALPTNVFLEPKS